MIKLVILTHELEKSRESERIATSESCCHWPFLHFLRFSFFHSPSAFGLFYLALFSIDHSLFCEYAFTTQMQSGEVGIPGFRFASSRLRHWQCTTAGRGYRMENCHSSNRSWRIETPVIRRHGQRAVSWRRQFVYGWFFLNLRNIERDIAELLEHLPGLIPRHLVRAQLHAPDRA